MIRASKVLPNGTLQPRESDEQIALMQWAKSQEYRIPELRLLYSVPNQGVGRNRRLQQEGAKPGAQDISLDVARGGFHGLRIELKIKGGQRSDEQKAWHRLLAQQGYLVGTCWGQDAARSLILRYLGNKLRVQPAPTPAVG